MFSERPRRVAYFWRSKSQGPHPELQDMEVTFLKASPTDGDKVETIYGDWLKP